MTEIKKVTLTENELDQISGGISTKKALLIGGLAVIGAGAIGFGVVAYKKGWFIDKKDDSPAVAPTAPTAPAAKPVKKEETKSNIIYQDMYGVGHNAPENPSVQCPSVIYMDNTGVGHFYRATK